MKKIIFWVIVLTFLISLSGCAITTGWTLYSVTVFPATPYPFYYHHYYKTPKYYGYMYHYHYYPYGYDRWRLKP